MSGPFLPPPPPGSFPPPPPPPPPPMFWASPSPPPSGPSAITTIVIVVVVLVVALAAVGAFLAFTAIRQSTQFTQATVNSVVWDLNYSGNASYFGWPSQYGCASCPITGLVGTPFTVTMRFTNSATAQIHDLRGYLVGPPFALVSVAPTPPTAVAPGATTNVALTATFPAFAGTYDMTVTVETS
ncbi:MAG TPA: hypothetical protein VEY07_03635 [Thermoplasmata archaeon]|nr:hypothetical protein [Thermoplasmata archaeon]